MGWEWAFKTPPLPTQVLSQLSHWSTDRPEKAKGNGGGRKTGSMYTRGEQSLRNSLCQKGAAHTALKHLACGDRGRDCPTPL